MRNSFLLFLAALIWGTAFVAQSVGMDYIGPFTFSCMRSLVGSLFLAVCIGVRIAANRKQKPASVIVTKEGIRGGLCCGLVLFAACNLQQVGILYTSVGKSGFITAFYIVLVPVLGIVLGRRVRPLVWGCVVLAVTGLYFLCINGSVRLQFGDALLLGCAFLFAVHILVIDHFTVRADGMVMSCIQFLVCGILSGVCMFLFEEPLVVQIRAAWFPILYAGVFSSGVAYTLQIIGQKGLNPTVACLIMSLESVVSVLAGMVFLHQILQPREVFGCALMLAAVVLVQLPERNAGGKEVSCD